MPFLNTQLDTRPLTQDERFNFLAFLADMISFFAASVLLSSITILPLFASRLTDRAEIIALIPALANLGTTVPQFLGARAVRGYPRYRPFVVRIGLLERLSVLGAVVSMALLAKSHPLLLLGVPLLFLFFWWGLMGINGPAYAAMLERSVAARRRGRLFGLGAALGGVTGLGFAWIARRLIEDLPFPFGFVACAGVALVALVLGFIPLVYVREADIPVEHRASEQSGGGVMQVLRTDSRYRLFLMSQVAYAFQAMPTAIYTTYALTHFHAGARHIVAITAILAAVGAIGSIASGWLADHYGNRAVALWSAALAAAALVCAWGAPNLLVYMLSFVPARLAWSGVDLASYNILMEFAPPGQVPAYSAASGVVTGPCRVLAPVLGGWGVAAFSPAAVFLLAGLAAVISAVTLLYVPEPRHGVRGRLGEHPA